MSDFFYAEAEWEVLSCPECKGVWITPEQAREEGLL